ncbi:MULTISPECIES: rod shape-determining protein MreC [Prochlorococcus]|uniref:rod shape-determining protein MreC n=1 Tax=Prochlorococcus TaxID=1218 RepID=UPI0005338ADC|nr:MULTISPECIES: rod shape-determining protein MreC [Prochlorococcus]KGG13651.1 Rod shape-determining protein MreC [Prochlorococcus sp. MIT 0601]
MGSFRRDASFRWWNKKSLWFWVGISILFSAIRFAKGAYLIDIYSLIVSPFTPGIAQKEWIQSSANLEQQIKLTLLQKDNQRLRNLLELKASSGENRIPAVVISRKTSGFWQQLDINKGSKSGIKTSDVVLGPGGVLGIIDSTTPTTSRVRLLTSPQSKIGVWVERTKVHGILVGNGNNRPQINFLDKSSETKVGDIVSTSSASTLLPPNEPIGVIKFINAENLPSPYGFVQLLAHPEAIDWVEIIGL